MIGAKLFKRSFESRRLIFNSIKVVKHNQLRLNSTACPMEPTKCTKGLVLGLYAAENECEKPRFTARGEYFDSQLNGLLTTLINSSEFQGELGQFRLFNGIDKEFGSICVVGLGEEGIGYNDLQAVEQGYENARVAAGIGARQLRDTGCSSIQIDPMEYPEQVAEGSALATWRYQENKSKRLPVPKLELYDSADEDEWTRGLFKADAQNLVRTLCEAPSNQLTPTAFAQAAVDALCPCGVTVDVRNLDWIQQVNLSSFLSVAKSSCESPIFLEIRYCGNHSESQRPILLAGSGITFNSGGLCSKSSKGMSEYRASMAGAASVVATMRAAAALQLPLNLVAVIPLCENMASGMAFKPGDIITALDGRTIGVHSTDFAHRLILADSIVYGQAHHKPRLVVDIGTFTDGISRALGGGASGVCTNSNFIWHQIRKAGALTGDRVWLLPSWKYFQKMVTSYDNIDVSNVGHGKAEPCLGAAYIREFIPCVDWLHLDVSGTGMRKKSNNLPYLEKNRMTGRPVRTLIQFLYQISCPEEANVELS